MDANIHLNNGLAPASPFPKVKEALNTSTSNFLHTYHKAAGAVSPEHGKVRRERRRFMPALRIVTRESRVSLEIFNAADNELLKEIPLPGVGEVLKNLNITKECCVDYRS